MSSRTLPLVLTSFVILCSCASGATDDASRTLQEDGGNMDRLAQAVAERTQGGFQPTTMAHEGSASGQQPAGSGKIVMHPIVDARTGMVASQIPLPDTWRITTPRTAEDPHIVGPNGIQVFYRSGRSHMYSNDPFIQESYRMAGQAMRPPVPIEQLIQQDLDPNLKREGLRPVKNYPLPDVARRNEQYSSKLWKAAPSRESFYAMGSEWLDKEGKPVLIIVNQTVSQGQNDVFWSYNLQLIAASAPYFEEAKKAFLYGIVNTQDNPQQIAAYNANEQQKSNQSWSQHTTKMQQDQAAFDQRQAAHRSTVDAVNNSMMSIYHTQNASSDRQQRNTVNMINGEETVTNPMDGNQYQVESGANQYWMNANGEYIPNNDAFYNPNADPNINHQEWQEVTPE